MIPLLQGGRRRGFAKGVQHSSRNIPGYFVKEGLLMGFKVKRIEGDRSPRKRKVGTEARFSSVCNRGKYLYPLTGHIA